MPTPSVGAAAAATPLTTIELTDCIARGEADFLGVEDLQPVHLLWDNGLLITTERLLSAGGGQAAPKLDEMLRIELRHVTAAVRGGLCRLTSTPSSPYQLTAQFVCTDSILIGSPGVPLIEQEGAAGVENFRQRFLWNGDRVFYQDVDVFWTARSLDADAPPDVMTFEAWKTYWGPSRENQPSTERLMWRKTARRGPAVARLHARRLYSRRSDVRRRLGRRARLPGGPVAAAAVRDGPEKSTRAGSVHGAAQRRSAKG